MRRGRAGGDIWGDEFVAVVTIADESQIMLLIERFLENVARKNRVTKDLNMSIAYGYASGSQNTGSIEKVYQIADDRMYEKKKQMKS